MRVVVGRKSLRGVLVVPLLTIAACAGTVTQRIDVDPAAAAREAELQKEVYVKRSLRDQIRVQNLAFPLLTRAVEICGDDVHPILGILPLNRDAWPKDYQAAATSALNIDERLTVVNVTPHSPADAAGFKVGDVLLSMGGTAIPTGKNAANHFLKLTEKQLTTGQPTNFLVNRESLEVSLDVTPVKACSYLVAVTGDDQVNAFADGKNIYITSGMLRFAESDTEVSTVLGHELAHNAMGHIEKKRGNQLLGTVFDLVAAAYGVNTQNAFGNAAAQAYSQDFEAEADYVGLYALELSGASIVEAPDFWRRMGANSPGSIKTTYSSTHPGTAERYLALDGTVKEIENKKANGEPLQPNIREAKGK